LSDCEPSFSRFFPRFPSLEETSIRLSRIFPPPTVLLLSRLSSLSSRKRPASFSLVALTLASPSFFLFHSFLLFSPLLPYESPRSDRGAFWLLSFSQGASFLIVPSTVSFSPASSGSSPVLRMFSQRRFVFLSLDFIFFEVLFPLITKLRRLCTSVDLEFF